MFTNLSKHPVTILSPETETVAFTFNGREYLALKEGSNEQVATILPPWEGEVPTVKTDGGYSTVIDGVKIQYTGFTTIENLPAPVDNIIYVVSAMTAAATSRNDVVAPGPLLFREPHQGRGEIVGCLGLRKSLLPI